MFPEAPSPSPRPPRPVGIDHVPYGDAIRLIRLDLRLGRPVDVDDILELAEDANTDARADTEFLKAELAEVEDDLKKLEEKHAKLENVLGRACELLAGLYDAAGDVLEPAADAELTAARLGTLKAALDGCPGNDLSDGPAVELAIEDALDAEARKRREEEEARRKAWAEQLAAVQKPKRRRPGSRG